jgi:hypothetical protein
MLLQFAVRDIGQLTDLGNKRRGSWEHRSWDLIAGTTAMGRFVAVSASITWPQSYSQCKVILAAT